MGATRFFDNWNPMIPCDLPKNDNIVQHILESTRKTRENVHLFVNVLGSGGDLTGALGALDNLLTAKDWLSLYRAQARTLFIRAPDDLAVHQSVYALQSLDHQLFDTTKYFGSSPYLTVITYGTGQLGSLHLFGIGFEASVRTDPSRGIAGA
jgi:hypothetical protein